MEVKDNQDRDYNAAMGILESLAVLAAIGVVSAAVTAGLSRLRRPRRWRHWTLNPEGTYAAPTPYVPGVAFKLADLVAIFDACKTLAPLESSLSPRAIEPAPNLREMVELERGLPLWITRGRVPLAAKLCALDRRFELALAIAVRGAACRFE